MQNTETRQVPAEIAALNDLRAEAQTAEDHAYLDSEAARIEQERKDVLSLGQPIGALTLKNGVVVEQSLIDAQRAAGQEEGTPYSGNRRA